MNGLKGAEKQLSFSGKTAGKRKAISDRGLRNLLIKEVKDFPVGSEINQSV